MTGSVHQHPSQSELALLAGGDLGFWRTLLVSRHVRKCHACLDVTAGYAAERDQLHESAQELPSGLDWNTLSREITGNIRVGLEAGECIEPFLRPARRRFVTWNLTTALATVTIAATVGLWFNIPQPQKEHLLVAVSSMVRGNGASQAENAEGPVLRVSPAGLSLEENRSSMGLLPPGTAEGLGASVSLQGAVEQRYVDADSGQMTINKVSYVQ
jgi:hypothetical protein